MVLDTARAEPRKMLSVTVHSSRRPTPKPAHTMTLIWTSPVTPDRGNTRTSRRMLNSSPTENMTRMTPNSERA